MIQWLATITPFQELLASNTTLRRGMEICESFAGFYIPALQGLMQRPEVLQGEPGELLLELLLTGDGHLRVAAMGGYMRERYLHEGRWIPALTALGARAQLVWATDDPIANVALGRELSRRCPEARYVELPGLGHFLLMEDPARVAAEVRAFVGGLAR
ncbi:MAG: alpha/beta hydrolase [Deltaproteobacteria bacterium]|nr:alpha/beta hydrolase [Deltaproteobacteria bacterium]